MSFSGEKIIKMLPVCEMNFIVAIVTDIHQVLKRQRYGRIINVTRRKLLSVVYDVPGALVADLTQAAVNINAVTDECITAPLPAHRIIKSPSEISRHKEPTTYPARPQIYCSNKSRHTKSKEHPATRARCLRIPLIRSCVDVCPFIHCNK